MYIYRFAALFAYSVRGTPKAQNSTGLTACGSSVRLNTNQVSAFHLHLGSPERQALCVSQSWLQAQKEGSAVPRSVNDQGTPSYIFSLVLLPCVSQPLMLKMMTQKGRER